MPGRPMRTRRPSPCYSLATLATIASLWAPVAAAETGCAPVTVDAARYTVCRIDLAATPMRTFLHDSDGRPYGGFAALDDALRVKGERLVIATNAGMYHEDRSPVGLYVEDGRRLAAANTRKGPGNFHLLPNGVFWIRGRTAGAAETRAFVASKRTVDFATQSGPMLVIGGRIHPRFDPDSTSAKIRNGVCALGSGEVVLAISEVPVTFHAFARLFRDTVGCRDALFLDGSVSVLHDAASGRSDGWGRIGPILGAVAPLTNERRAR